MTIDEMIAVLQAAKAGKAEWQFKGTFGWSPFTISSVESSGIAAKDFNYRVKPGPREWFVNDYGAGVVGGLSSTEEEARTYGSCGATIFKVREVL